MRSLRAHDKEGYPLSIGGPGNGACRSKESKNRAGRRKNVPLSPKNHHSSIIVFDP
jgi:hypothetical protein